jgi:hypothetical protein
MMMWKPCGALSWAWRGTEPEARNTRLKGFKGFKEFLQLLMEIRVEMCYNQIAAETEEELDMLA